MAALRRAALALLLAATPAAAGTITYVETQPASCPSARCDALGYPVPQPLATQTPGAGFRRYDALQAQLQALALDQADLVRVELGRTLSDRPILGYVLSDADATTPDGFAEPALLHNGGIHAREWASPEVVAAIIERFAERADDAGLHRYLLDATRLTLIPVLNVDGFLQTQRYPELALETRFAGDGPDWPRDGRMRRKNLRDADEDLSDANDNYLHGVDPNRNHAPYFGSGNQNSADLRSLVHRGAAAGSEAESQALYAAAQQAPAARLRLFIDTHSFGRVFFAADTANTRRNALQQALWSTMNAATGGRYAYDATPPGVGIGSTDEHFANTYQVPAYTLEIEPGPEGANPEYAESDGAFGVTHDGFILPATQLARVREELAMASIAGYYRMAGPPAVSRAEVRERDSGGLVYAAHWSRRSDTARTLNVATRATLRNEVDYTLWVAFDKPMRVRDAGGAVAQYAGQSIALAPQVRIEGLDATGAPFSFSVPTTAGGWRASAGGAPAGYWRYADDAYAVDFRVPAATALAGARRLYFALDVRDFVGQRLDAEPATALDLVDGGWARYENTALADGGDSGGEDRRTIVLVEDTGATVGGAAPGGGGGGALGGLALFTLLLGLVARRGALGLRSAHPTVAARPPGRLSRR